MVSSDEARRQRLYGVPQGSLLAFVDHEISLEISFHEVLRDSHLVFMDQDG